LRIGELYRRILDRVWPPASEAAERLVEGWPLVEPAVKRCYDADLKAVTLLRALP